ncbi:MAG TPA: hypothetical protein VME24_13520 [Alphaproteobacteria bacterium]|nr:hypothetical protein [Alphaproteobacteria bacterium]
MNHTELFDQESESLLEAIRETCSVVGDGLKDEELTALLGQTALPIERGFSFLSFSHGYVTISVPRQDPDNWYMKDGGIVPGKAGIAKWISAKYGLSLYEPVDVSARVYQNGGLYAHCHLEFADRRQTVIIAHPCYLKIRLFGVSPEHRYACETLTPLPLGPDLLEDLSELYQSNFKNRESIPCGPESEPLVQVG